MTFSTFSAALLGARMMSPAPRQVFPERRLPGWSLRLSAEEELLLLCARADRDAAQTQRMRALAGAAELDWQRFGNMAAEQEVLALVSRALTELELAGQVPHPVLQDARRARLETLARNLSLHSELGRIASCLHASGIPVVPLKGTCLAQRLFASLELRRVGDIDVLVPESRLAEARSALFELGYAAIDGQEHHAFHGAPYVRQTATMSFVVELHWGLNDPEFVTVDYEELWRRVLTTSVDEQPLRDLPGEETLLYLALHLAKHHHGVLRLLADVDRLVRREGPHLDWSHVVRLAGQWHVSVLLYFALHRSESLLGTPLPEGLLAQLRPTAWRRLVVEHFAGPAAVLRPPARSTLRYSRVQLAYCAMLTPLGRSLAAYRHYLCLPSDRPRRGPVGRLMCLLEAPLGGVGRTALAVGSLAGDRFS